MTGTLEAKIGRVLVVGFAGLTAPDYVLDWLATERIGGVILFRRNIANPEQLTALVQSCHEAAPRPILVAIDQEGGRVARLHHGNGFTESPGAMALAATGSEAIAESVSAVLAAEMRAMGINWVLAPVVDIAHDKTNFVIGTRALGTDSEQVARLACAEVRGFQQAGVPATAKHFPGHGNTPVDTHEALAVVSGSVDYLWEHDLIPFRATVAAGVASVMVSHVKFEALDADYPATLSPRITTDLLRGEIGFEGMACSDCMEMKAITDHYGAGESAVLGILAGLDVLFFSHTQAYQAEAFEAILNAVRNGRISESRLDEAIARIDRMLAAYPVSAPDVTQIRQAAHLQVMQQAAEQSLTLLESVPDTLPLEIAPGERLGVVEFGGIQDTQAIESGTATTFIHLLQQQQWTFESVALHPVKATEGDYEQAEALAQNSDVLLIATRNAHLYPHELKLTQHLINQSRRVIVLCLANPYDALALTGADALLCSYGDSQPSLAAVVAALKGTIVPSGRLPVALS